MTMDWNRIEIHFKISNFGFIVRPATKIQKSHLKFVNKFYKSLKTVKGGYLVQLFVKCGQVH
jgi:hypothetical protein